MAYFSGHVKQRQARALARLFRRLRGRADVTGVDLGYRVSGGQPADGLCLRVHVSRKSALGTEAGAVPLPARFDDLPVERIAGDFRPEPKGLSGYCGEHVLDTPNAMAQPDTMRTLSPVWLGAVLTSTARGEAHRPGKGRWTVVGEGFYRVPGRVTPRDGDGVFFRGLCLQSDEPDTAIESGATYLDQETGAALGLHVAHSEDWTRRSGPPLVIALSLPFHDCRGEMSEADLMEVIPSAAPDVPQHQSPAAPDRQARTAPRGVPELMEHLLQASAPRYSPRADPRDAFGAGRGFAQAGLDLACEPLSVHRDIFPGLRAALTQYFPEYAAIHPDMAVVDMGKAALDVRRDVVFATKRWGLFDAIEHRITHGGLRKCERFSDVAEQIARWFWYQDIAIRP